MLDALQPLHDAPELAGHARHAAAVVAATDVEYVPAPQLVHAAEPVVLLYEPAAHAAHGPPLGPVYPALQSATTQAALDVLATGEVKPAGHAVHDAVPDVPLYFAVSHAVHAFAAGHVVSVRSKPPVISAAIAVSVASVMYSSTKKKPAMSPLNLAVVSAALIEPNITEVVKSCIRAVDKIQKIGGLVI